MGTFILGFTAGWLIGLATGYMNNAMTKTGDSKYYILDNKTRKAYNKKIKER